MKYLVLLYLSSCGVAVHTDPIQVNPIEVNVNFNLEALKDYCKTECEKLYQDPIDVNKCSTDCIGALIASLSGKK